MSAISGSKGPDFTVLQTSLPVDNQQGVRPGRIRPDPDPLGGGIYGEHRRLPPEIIIGTPDEHPTEISQHDIDVPGPIPDTESMSPEEVYDLFYSFVQEYGSQKAKDDLAAGQKIALRVSVGGVEVGFAVLDGRAQTAFYLPSTGHGGSSDPSLECGVPLDPSKLRPKHGPVSPINPGERPDHEPGTNPETSDRPELPPFFARIFQLDVIEEAPSQDADLT